jgi:hypothetical protein
MLSQVRLGTNLVLGDLDVRLEVLHDVLRLKVPDLNRVLGRSAEPVAVGREAEGVDDGARIQRVQPLPLSQIPQQSNTVLPAGGAERSIGAHGDGVNISAMTIESAAQLAVRKVPDLDGAVPGTGDNGGLKCVWGEPDAGDPPVVALAATEVTSDGVLALTEGVPELNGLVAGRGDDLAVVNGEGNGEDILLVADEAAGGEAGGEVPEAELSIPGAGKGELAVGTEDDVLDEVGVAGEAAEGDAVVGGGAGFRGGVDRVGQVPHQQGLVAGGGDDERRVVDRGRDRRHLAVVAAHRAHQREGLLRASHGCCEGLGLQGLRWRRREGKDDAVKGRKREMDSFIVGRNWD